MEATGTTMNLNTDFPMALVLPTTVITSEWALI
jgi:hypothetical protein